MDTQKVVMDLAYADTTREYYTLAALCWTHNRDEAIAAVYRDGLVRQCCRFGSEQQARTAVNYTIRRIVRVRFGNHMRTIDGWSKCTGIPVAAIWNRLERGEPVGKALGYYAKAKPAKACKRKPVPTSPDGTMGCT